MQKPRNKILFRASSAAKLLSGLKEWTDKNEAEFQELEARKKGIYLTPSGRKGGYSETQKEKHIALIERRKEGTKLGQTAKTFVEEMWLTDNFGYRTELSTREILKGQLCEQDSMSIVSDLYPANEFRRKNVNHFDNEYFRGTPDVILKDGLIVEDVKTSWDISTYFKIRNYSSLYFGQGQVYMDLTGAREFNLYYCLVNTPIVLLDQIEKSLFWKFGGSENSDLYIKQSEQLWKNHTYDKIPKDLRVKKFSFEYDSQYIEKLKECAELGRDYYQTLTLDKIDASLMEEETAQELEDNFL